MTLTIDDIIAIQALNVRYAIALDDLVQDSASKWAETFTSDGDFTLIAGDGTTVLVRASGSAQLSALQRSFPNPHFTRHWFSNLLIESDAQDARMTSYISAISVATAPAIARTGVYRDTLVRAEAGWRFRSRILTLDPGSHV